MLLDIHLTNVAVQRTAPDFDPEKGCKWSTQQLRMYLCAKHGTDAVSLTVSRSLMTGKILICKSVRVSKSLTLTHTETALKLLLVVLINVPIYFTYSSSNECETVSKKERERTGLVV